MKGRDKTAWLMTAAVLAGALLVAFAARPRAAGTVRLPVEVVGCHVDVEQPDVPSALGDAARAGRADRAVVVPLLLSAGYHVYVDLAEAAAAAPLPTAVTAALGPDPRLIPDDRRSRLDGGLQSSLTFIRGPAEGSFHRQCGRGCAQDRGVDGLLLLERHPPMKTEGTLCWQAQAGPKTH